MFEVFLPTLFEHETNPIRFERVCIDIYRAAEGLDLVPTSRSWDQGRDARPISVRTQVPAQQPIICVSLEGNVDRKIEADVQRTRRTTTTKSLVFCTPHPLSEVACDKIEARIRTLDPQLVTVRVLGRVQLVALGERYPEVIQKHYGAELANLESALTAGAKPDASPEKIGLRLALVAQTGDDARTLRFDLAKHLLLEALNTAGPASAGDLATRVSGRLHLPRSLSRHYVSEVLQHASRDGLVARTGETYDLTSAGGQLLATVPIEAGDRLLEGRKAIRNAIRSLSGHDLTDDQYEGIWNVLQDGLAQLFYEHGAAIVRMVSGILTGSDASPDRSLTRGVIERLGDKVLPLFSSPDQGAEVRLAIIDMFSETGQEAFQWLTQICSVYMVMCSLGFETLSTQEVTSVLRKLWFVPDSDVVISLLCVGEPNHEEIKRVVDTWRQLGGKLLVSPPVLEEVAYHAWISELDYIGVADRLQHASEAELQHLSSNAFVRGFRRVAEQNTSRKHWNQYIAEFKGETNYDYSKVLEILRDDLSFQVLPASGDAYKGVVERIREFLTKRSSEEARCEPGSLDHRVEDKCHRDAILLGAIKAQRDVAVSGVSGRAVVVSSARLLREAEEVFKRDFGPPDAVVSVAAVGCLLTLVPGVQMGLGTLRGVLFDPSLATRLNPIQRFAYRMIAQAGEHDLPWSRRATLVRELGDRLLADARAYGQPMREIRNKVFASEDPVYSASVVADALRRMAVTSKTEKEVVELRREVERLSEELAQREEESRVPAASGAHRKPPARPRRRRRRR